MIASTPIDLSTFVPVGAHTSVSDLSSAVTLTPPAGADRIYLQAVGQSLRYTFDGTVPTATIGFQFPTGGDGALFVLKGSASLKFIQETAGASMQYQWGAPG